MHLLGIDWAGLTEQNGRKLLLSVSLLLAAMLARVVLRALARAALRGGTSRALRARSWTHRGIDLLVALAVASGLLSIWFDDPMRLATAFGLVGAGLALALHRVITALAGYAAIRHGNAFAVGDRISMGGVRGLLWARGTVHTPLRHVGGAPGRSAGPAAQVGSRQFTGRIVTVTNAKVFDEPIYNHAREFPYLWEQLSVPIRYGGDRARAEAILLDAAGRYALDPGTISEQAARTLERRFDLKRPDFEPQVYYRLTASWLELTVRFAVTDRGTRSVRDRVARDVLTRFEAAGISVATAEHRIIGLPPVDVRDGRAADR